MKWIAIPAVVVAALMSPTGALGYSFGDWASDQGYSPGAAMPNIVNASGSLPAIDSLGGIDQFNWAPTVALWLRGNQLSSIEPGTFDGLTRFKVLDLASNQLSSIEPGTFDGLPNLDSLFLEGNQLSSIEFGDFSGLPNLTLLQLYSNQISSIESGDFSGLPNLTNLDLDYNQISSIESGAFSGLTNLEWLFLSDNIALTELNLSEADFSSLSKFNLRNNVNITSVSLKNVVVNQTSLARLLDGGHLYSTSLTGIGDLDGISEMDLSGVDFGNITDLGPLHVMGDLTDLRLVDTVNLDALELDILLDNLATIEGVLTEGVLYMTQADFDAFNTAGGGLLTAWDAELGHHVAIIPEPSTLLLAALAAVGLMILQITSNRRSPAC